MNTELNFTVELRPQLPAGTYNIVRRIDIDPPVNGQPTWINYGHEIIGKITILEDSNEMLVSLFKTGDSSLVNKGTSEDTKVEEKELTQKETDLTTPEQKSGLSRITGNIIEDISSSVDNKIIVGILCLIVFVLGIQTTVLYKLSRKK